MSIAVRTTGIEYIQTRAGYWVMAGAIVFQHTQSNHVTYWLHSVYSVFAYIMTRTIVIAHAVEEQLGHSPVFTYLDANKRHRLGLD